MSAIVTRSVSASFVSTLAVIAALVIFWIRIVRAFAPKVIIPLLAAHVPGISVVVVRVRIIIVFETVVVVVSVCVLELHFRVNSVLYFLQEIQDAVLVAEIASASFNKLDARLLMQRRNDDIAVEVLDVKLASSFAHNG